MIGTEYTKPEFSCLNMDIEDTMLVTGSGNGTIPDSGYNDYDGDF